MIVVVIIFLVAGLVLGAVALLAYRKILRRAKGIERGLKMVPILIHLPPSPDAEQSSTRDAREVMREKVSQAQALYDLIAGTALTGFKSRFYGQRHISLELVAGGGFIHYYLAVPVALVSVVEKAVLTAYPGARLEQTEDYNIFNPNAKIAGTSGGELTLKKAAAYPIATIDKLERDPMEAVINSMTQLAAGEGAAIQILLRPANPGWVKRSAILAKKRRAKGVATSGIGFGVKDLAKAAVKAPDVPKTGAERQLTGLEQSEVEAIENKTRHAGYEVLIRMVAAADNVSRSQIILRDMASAFALFDAPGLNGFKFLPAGELEGLVTAFIFRFFPPELNSDILNSLELAGLYHLPDGAVTATRQVERQSSKQIDGPPMVPTQGLLFGFNEFRGNRKEIRLAPDDRRRHTYILGQTGSGKSILLENLAVQDMLAGNGFAFIDPHGDTAEKLISMVPKSRVEDVIYFNPADTEFPLGLNLFEFSTPEQKDFLVQEAINMLYKIYDPQKQGVIGPRFEQWFRNAALTLMADPSGATFIEVPKVFLDAEFLKAKFKFLKDPTVIDFWTKEMAQTSDYHKSEMLGWFASKFGAFQQNEIMRNIIGQTKSAFNLRDIMDQKKILIVNLSKGQIGELNSKLLGMIFVIKFQAAAMSRAGTDPAQRPDFCLYVDEFQNFSTDSFASILSEARKYGLNLIVANQFIGQLTNEIRDAVFGNVGTMISFRTGPEDAEFLVKQFSPVFDAHDLVNLEIGHAAIRLLISGLPSQPFSITTLPPLDLANKELGLAVKQLSAAKFGATRAQVEATIFGRLGTVAAPAPAGSGMAGTLVPAGAGPQPLTSVPAPVAAPAIAQQPAPANQASPALSMPVSSGPVAQSSAVVARPAESLGLSGPGQLASGRPANDYKPAAAVPNQPLPLQPPSQLPTATAPVHTPVHMPGVPAVGTAVGPVHGSTNTPTAAPATPPKPAVSAHNSLSINDIVKDMQPKPVAASVGLPAASALGSAPVQPLALPNVPAAALAPPTAASPIAILNSPAVAVSAPSLNLPVPSPASPPPPLPTALAPSLPVQPAVPPLAHPVTPVINVAMPASTPIPQAQTMPMRPVAAAPAPVVAPAVTPLSTPTPSQAVSPKSGPEVNRAQAGLDGLIGSASVVPAQQPAAAAGAAVNQLPSRPVASTLATPSTIAAPVTAAANLSPTKATAAVEAKPETTPANPVAEPGLTAAKEADDNLAAEIESAGLGAVIKLVGGNAITGDKDEPVPEQTPPAAGPTSHKVLETGLVPSANSHQPASEVKVSAAGVVSETEAKSDGVGGKAAEGHLPKPKTEAESHEATGLGRSQSHHAQRHEAKTEHQNGKKEHHGAAQHKPLGSQHGAGPAPKQPESKAHATHHKPRVEHEPARSEHETKAKAAALAGGAELERHSTVAAETQPDLAHAGEHAKPMPAGTKGVSLTAINATQSAPLSTPIGGVKSASLSAAVSHPQPLANSNSVAAVSGLSAPAAASGVLQPIASPVLVDQPKPVTPTVSLNSVPSAGQQPIKPIVTPAVPLPAESPKVPVASAAGPVAEPRTMAVSVPAVQPDVKLSSVQASEPVKPAVASPVPVAPPPPVAESKPETTLEKLLSQPKPDAALVIAKPAVIAPTSEIKPVIPVIEPGEVYVDADGVVHTVE